MTNTNLINQLRGESDGHFRGMVRDRRTIGVMLYEAADALTDAQERIEALEGALTRIENLASLVAHDLTGRVEGGKVAAVYQCAEVARAALRKEGEA